MFLFVVTVWVFLLPNNKGGNLGADIYLGSTLPTSPLHHRGREGQKGGQGSQQWFIILNATGEEEEERKKSNVLF